ncbi:unnamed protein product, partial [Amoebophrya sp. A120]
GKRSCGAAGAASRSCSNLIPARLLLSRPHHEENDDSLGIATEQGGRAPTLSCFYARTAKEVRARTRRRKS